MRANRGTLFIFAMAFLFSFGLAAPPAGATPPFLYVLSAKKVKIEAAEGGDHLLVIKKAHIEHVLEISEAPFKMANSISGDKIVNTWKTGAGDFGTDITMKGSVLGADHSIAGINIKSISKTEEDMRFVFFQDDMAALDLKQVGVLKQVVIVNYCCQPEGGSGQWLWGQ